MTQLRTAAGEAIDLYPGEERDSEELAADITGKVRLIGAINDEIDLLDARIATLCAKADPSGIVASVPGVGAVLAAGIRGRLPWTTPTATRWTRTARRAPAVRLAPFSCRSVSP